MIDANAPGIDASRLAELSEVLGRDRVERLLAVYLIELQAAPRTFADHARIDDPHIIRSAGHRFRGAALNLGCASVADVAARISVCDMADVETLLIDLGARCTATVDAIRMYLDAEQDAETIG